MLQAVCLFLHSFGIPTVRRSFLELHLWRREGYSTKELRTSCAMTLILAYISIRQYLCDCKTYQQMVLGPALLHAPFCDAEKSRHDENMVDVQSVYSPVQQSRLPTPSFVQYPDSFTHVTGAAGAIGLALLQGALRPLGHLTRVS